MTPRGRRRIGARATLAALAVTAIACSGSPTVADLARPGDPSGAAPSAVPSTVADAAPGSTAPPGTTAAVPPPTTAAPAGPPADPAGAGDEYFPTLGNGGYDVEHYDIALRADPPATEVALRVTITARATATLANFHLDLAGMAVTATSVDGVTAAVRRDGAELVITPASAIAAGARFVTVVEYSGTPRPIADPALMSVGWLRAGGATFVVSEPNGAHSWLASNDHPSDKATFAFRIDVPDGITAAANGRLVSSDTANGRTVWTWTATEPMATYLATIAIGSFTVLDRGEHAGVRIRHVVPPALASQLDAAFARTAEMIDVLDDVFGPYPFSDYGVLVIDARLGYALETQTLSLFDRQIALSSSSAAFQVHELAHQWFGDSVTPRAWRDIWLNEGFATYAESLWRERTEAGFDIDAAMRAQARRGYGPIGDPGPANLFDDAVYQRGALTLHALRRTVGDDAFFRIVRAWATERVHANGSTDEFIALASRIAGRDVGPLVRSWLNDDPMPALP